MKKMTSTPMSNTIKYVCFDQSQKILKVTWKLMKHLCYKKVIPFQSSTWHGDWLDA